MRVMLLQEQVSVGALVAGFAVSVVRFVRTLPRPVVTDPIVGQVARSAAGITANYRAACAASSRAELIAKLAAAADDAADAEHWLWMIGQLGLAGGARFDALVEGSRELRAALVASTRSARRARP